MNIRNCLVIATALAFLCGCNTVNQPPQDKVSVAFYACAADFQSDIKSSLAASLEKNKDKVSGSMTAEGISSVKSDFIDTILKSKLSNDQQFELIKDFNNKVIPCLQKYLPPPGTADVKNLKSLIEECEGIMTNNVNMSRSSTYSIQDIVPKVSSSQGVTTILLFGGLRSYGFGSDVVPVAFKCTARDGMLLTSEPVDPRKISSL